MAIRTLDSLDLDGKKVLVRVDFNVPLDAGQVGDDTRIRAAIPTIEELLERGAAVILCSHLGRPKGQVVPRYSLRPVAGRLEELIGKPVAFAEDCVGDAARQAVDALEPGGLLLLENLRFHAGEEKNDPDFARQLAELADCYVNDAFGAAHRAHASTEGVAHLLPSAAGRLMEREVAALSRVLEEPDQPVVVIIGGAKVSDKIGVLDSFIGRAQAVLIGGGMANTFLQAAGREVGGSLSEPELADQANELVRRGQAAGTRMVLPVDVVVAPSLDAAGQAQTVDAESVPADQAIFDIGPRTVEAFATEIADAGTIVWNGPMGVFETEPFDQGTLGVAKAVAGARGFSLVGGGDSVAALNKLGMADQIDHVSTGGGASLEFLEGKTLPGIAALEEE
ncbi:MAG TPA: phosphoglycerate kinase [Thermomicrobiales bacterium]|nr:phosphoglycerate kinase [Thermomicrobiales bacterium]